MSTKHNASRRLGTLFLSMVAVQLAVGLACVAYATLNWHCVQWQRSEARRIEAIGRGGAPSTGFASVDRAYIEHYNWTVVSDSQYALWLGMCRRIGGLRLPPITGGDAQETARSYAMLSSFAIVAWLTLACAAYAGIQVRRVIVRTRNGVSCHDPDAIRHVVWASVMSGVWMMPIVAAGCWYAFYDRDPARSLAIGHFVPPYREIAWGLALLSFLLAYLAAHPLWNAVMPEGAGPPKCATCGYPLASIADTCPECGPRESIVRMKRLQAIIRVNGIIFSVFAMFCVIGLILSFTDTAAGHWLCLRQ